MFLSIGVRGADKTVGALTNVKKGLSETASISLEAKASILATMYALERLFATSGKAGTDLTNFNAVTGESVKTLQQYQYAARQVGVSNQDVENSFKGLQSTMTKTLMGEGAPKGLARVGLLTGGISQKDIQDYAKQPELLIQKLQEYSKKETNVGLRNETLKSFGISEGMIAGLSRNAFRPEVLKKAPTYSTNEIGQLDKANIAWSNLGNKIEMAVGHFNAKHGGQLVGDISKIVNEVVKLVEAFTKLSEKLHVFELIGKAFEGWGEILTGVSDTIDSITGAVADPKKRQPLIHNAIEGGKNVLGFANYLGEALGDRVSSALPGLQTMLTAEAMGNPSPVQKPQILGKQSVVPNSAKGNISNTGTLAKGTQNNTVKIDNHFQHPGTDHKKTGDSIKHSVQQAYRQMSAQSQGS